MAFQLTDIADLLKSVRTHYPSKEWTSIAQGQTEYVAFTQFFRDKSSTESGGEYLGFNVQYQWDDPAIFVGPYQTVTTNVGNSMVQGSTPWRRVYKNYAYDLTEKSLNSNDPDRIFDYIKTKRDAAWGGMAKGVDKNFWYSAASIDTTLDPYPAKYWVTMNSGASGGFTGGNHTSFTSGKGGISSAVYTGWKNYCDTYTSASDPDDLWEKLKKATVMTKFTSPIPNSGAKITTPKRTICVSYSTQQSLVKLAEVRNENLGKDLFWIDSPTLRGVPFLYVPNLDIATANNPDTPQTYDAVVGIDWSTFGIKFQKGWKMVESEPTKVANQPYVVRVDMTSMYNTFCDNVRNNFVIATNYAWSPSV